MKKPQKYTLFLLDYEMFEDRIHYSVGLYKYKFFGIIPVRVKEYFGPSLEEITKRAKTYCEAHNGYLVE